MKVLTKRVTIENADYYLISETSEHGKYYGTIPYTEVDENGNLKRVLNGAEMCISFNSVAEALTNRQRDTVLRRLLEKYMKNGNTDIEAMKEMINDPEYKALYNN